MKRKGRHPQPGESIDWARLPIFSVDGPAELRRAFLHRLQSAERSLDLAVLSGEEQRPYTLSLSARHHDLVIVEGKTPLPLQRIILGEAGKESPGDLSWPGPEVEAMEGFIDRLAARLDDLVSRTEVWACILIGGKSSRMGRPKHLITDDRGRTWLEKTVELLRPLVAGIAVSGKGLLPETLGDIVRLVDIPGISGPLTGILSACRWQPQMSWLLLACDMPAITPQALQWLLAGRRAGCWGRVPRLPGSERPEPLLAWYDCRAAQLFEEQLCTGNLRIGEVARHPRIDKPVVPEPLRHAFLNVNTPAELAAARPETI